MQPFIVETGIAAPLLQANIDTDVIMPKQFLKGIDRKGLAQGVFYHQRFLADGSPNPKFVLNTAEYQDAKFLVVGPNFGCGSSREHAVWGLKQLGIRALIGTTFAGIFFDNCQRNGLLVVEMAPKAFTSLVETFSKSSDKLLKIDLPNQAISLDRAEEVPFVIGQLRKQNLLAGLDTIGMTLQHTDRILDFEDSYLRQNGWLRSV